MIHDRRGRNDNNSQESQNIQIKVRQMNSAQYALMGIGQCAKQGSKLCGRRRGLNQNRLLPMLEFTSTISIILSGLSRSILDLRSSSMLCASKSEI